MAILTPEEKEFLDVFLHEATTSPFFNGPATKALYAIGVEYSDILNIAWAYEQDVPRTSFEIGHSAQVAPPLPWSTEESVRLRNQQIQRIWTQRRETSGARSRLKVDSFHTRNIHGLVEMVEVKAASARLRRMAR